MLAKLPYILVLLALLSCGHVALADDLLFAEGEWPPYVSKSIKGNGLAAEIVAAALAVEGLRYKLIWHPWKRSLNLVRKGMAAATFPWFLNQERTERYLPSDPILTSRVVFFYHKARFPRGLSYHKLRDLKEYRIGGALGYWYDHLFYQTGLQVSYANSTEISLKLLQRMRVDLVPETELVGWAMIDKLFPGRRDEFGTVEPPIRQDYLYVLFSKKHPKGAEMAARFNRGLALIKANGEYAAILARHGCK